MKHFLCTALVGIFLSSCGPAQQEGDYVDTKERILRAEKLFNGAYENLDAALMERLLAEDYTVSYLRPTDPKTREQFVGELGQLRTVFPDLRITIDSASYAQQTDHVTVGGIRTFSWWYEGVDGSYRERFTNVWRLDDGRWKLVFTELANYPSR